MVGREKREGTPASALLAWYDANARVLPWRIGPAARKKGAAPDPYAVWLSEVMLQQTTVATVTPRFQEFLDRWPNVDAMAKAPLDDVLGAWAGLGYYARARNLHKCAVEVAKLGGFPDAEEALRTLPGIGDYTAAAIAAIAFDAPAVVVDGNIERVTARLFAIETPIPAAKPEIKARIGELWPQKRSGDFAQALMDLGANVCTPRSPDCDACPLSKWCAAFARGDQESFPKRAVKAAKPTRFGEAYALFQRKGRSAASAPSGEGASRRNARPSGYGMVREKSPIPRRRRTRNGARRAQCATLSRISTSNSMFAALAPKARFVRRKVTGPTLKKRNFRQ
ncbi:MAG: A/G-specific adenine glycosylase [Parvularculaceae bacterium]